MKNESYLKKIDKIEFPTLKVGDLLFDYYDCEANGRWLLVVNKTDTHIFIFYLKDKQITKTDLTYWETKTKQYENNGYTSPLRKYFIVTKSVTK